MRLQRRFKFSCCRTIRDDVVCERAACFLSPGECLTKGTCFSEEECKLNSAPQIWKQLDVCRHSSFLNTQNKVSKESLFCSKSKAGMCRTMRQQAELALKCCFSSQQKNPCTVTVHGRFPELLQAETEREQDPDRSRCFCSPALTSEAPDLLTDIFPVILVWFTDCGSDGTEGRDLCLDMSGGTRGTLHSRTNRFFFTF